MHAAETRRLTHQHRDLKPGNVFLEEMSADNPPSLYPDYDRPMLGDYGIAVRTDDDDVFNPRGYNNRMASPASPPL